MFKLVKRQHIYRYNRTVEERLVKIYVPHVILKYTHIYFKDTLNSYTCDSENILLYFPMAWWKSTDIWTTNYLRCFKIKGIYYGKNTV